MPTLLELQTRFRDALLGSAADALAPDIADDGLAIEDRLDIYRTNVFASLERALAATFPAVRRLVDARFFAFAAAEFVRAHPPCRACLAEYGGVFAGFLAAFEPCRDLAYLPDIARLEWAINETAQAPDAVPIAPDALAQVAAGEAGNLILALHPSYRLLESPFPIDRIWRANQADEPAVATIDLAEGGVRLELWRQDEDPMVRRLDAASFAFRAALADGRCLTAATELALAAASGFDLAQGIAGLFHQGLVVGFRVEPEEGTK